MEGSSNSVISNEYLPFFNRRQLNVPLNQVPGGKVNCKLIYERSAEDGLFRNRV